MALSTSLKFPVRRQKPQLVRPSKPTPHEYKLLSDIDDQEGFRFQIPVIQFYPSMGSGKDPVKVIKQALADTLVFYYPFAGRLREGPNRKLMVDCTSEGIMFIEADADITLQQFGDQLRPPFPCFEELLYDVPGSDGVLHCPLLLIQVTRLQCGGFIFALRLNHTMSDAPGLVQFMVCVGEIARGATEPSILPVWQREIFDARDPPRITCLHREYAQVPETIVSIVQLDSMVHRSFFFGPAGMSAIRKLIPSNMQCKFTSFEVLTAWLWRCRTIALQPDPSEEVRVLFPVNTRGRFNPPPPVGYYGNAFVFPAAVSTAQELCQNPLSYAVKLVKKTKSDATEEYIKSVADLMVTKGRPNFKAEGSFIVSDVKRAGFENVDFGWGKAIFGGPANAILGVISFYIPYKNHKGDKGTLVPLCLPAPAMEIFERELQILLDQEDQLTDPRKNSILIKSAL